MKNQTFNPQGVLLREWDDETRTFHDYEAGTSRPYTTEENAEADERDATEALVTNQRSIEGKAVAALDANNTYLALQSPSNAQVVAQVRLLTRQNNALIRLVLKRLDVDDA